MPDCLWATYRFPAVLCSRVSFRLSVRQAVSRVIMRGSTIFLHCKVPYPGARTCYRCLGYRYQSVQLPSQPELRPSVGTLLLHGKEKEAFAAVTDEAICLWDSASGGQLLAVARFPVTLSGAKDALKSCDYTDLDEDGNSDLTAEFTFADGSTASLVWFYADGGLVYNGEFSRLPGETSAAGEN